MPTRPEQIRASESLPINSTQLPTSQVPTTSAREDLHPHWYIRAVIYLCAFLHTRHRVTFRAVALILVSLGFIFSMIAGDLVGAAAMPRTLKTVFSKLGMKDTFTVNPICFQCHRIFEPDITPDTFCPDCDEEVFGAPSPGAPHSDWDGNIDLGFADEADSEGPGKRKPYVVAPVQLLSTALHEFFMRPGMVSAVNAWKTQTPHDRELNSMQDGYVWKEIKGPDGESFFHGPDAEKEIRLGVSCSLDWYIHFVSFVSI
jgi:hypothetical protein